MADKAGSQGSQVYYDPDMGQYYTQTPQSRNPMEGFFNVLSGNIKGNRNYLNNFNQYSPALQQQSPYEYADVSLESLFPSMNQGGGNSALTGLLGGAPSATGSASSGAGRFM
jgi:hypothetical protein